LPYPEALETERFDVGMLWQMVAAGRYATILLIIAAVQAPGLAWAILAPGLALHLVFGLLSGWATYHLVSPTEASPAGGGDAIEVVPGGQGR
jgi:hypothetical protein